MIRGLLLAAALIAVQGCGFRPLYATQGQAEADIALSSVRIGPIRSARAQGARDLMRDVLPSRFPPSRGEERYVMSIALSESIQAVSVSIDSNARRFNYSLRGQVSYLDTETGERRNQNLQSLVSFAVVPSQYATLVGREDAVRRAVIDLARKIELDAALYAQGNASSTTGGELFQDRSQDPLRQLERDAETQSPLEETP